MNNIIAMPASSTLTTEQALHSALQNNLRDVLIIGYDDVGDLFIRSSRMDCKSALWLLKMAEKYTLNGGEND